MIKLTRTLYNGRSCKERPLFIKKEGILSITKIINYNREFTEITLINNEKYLVKEDPEDISKLITSSILDIK